jgi:chemotaxis response regulator CheB
MLQGLDQQRGQAVQSERIRVLVVDDHPLMREGIVAVIQGAADIIVVGEAGNGQQAIEMFRIHRPDVTFMDLQMPIMNGIDAIKAIAMLEITPDALGGDEHVEFIRR